MGGWEKGKLFVHRTVKQVEREGDRQRTSKKRNGGKKPQGVEWPVNSKLCRGRGDGMGKKRFTPRRELWIMREWQLNLGPKPGSLMRRRIRG